MFHGCSSLIKLPDISKWDTSKIINISCIFYNCNSLSDLPDISKWNTTNITDISCLFSDCFSLKSLFQFGIYQMFLTFMVCLENAQNYYLYLIYQNGI